MSAPLDLQPWFDLLTQARGGGLQLTFRWRSREARTTWTASLHRYRDGASPGWGTTVSIAQVAHGHELDPADPDLAAWLTRSLPESAGWVRDDYAHFVWHGHEAQAFETTHAWFLGFAKVAQLYATARHPKAWAAWLAHVPGEQGIQAWIVRWATGLLNANPDAWYSGTERHSWYGACRFRAGVPRSRYALWHQHAPALDAPGATVHPYGAWWQASGLAKGRRQRFDDLPEFYGVALHTVNAPQWEEAVAQLGRLATARPIILQMTWQP